MNKMIEPHWESFAESVIPDTAPAVQIKEMEMAFYSGAYLMYGLIQQIGAIDDEDDAVIALEKLDQEVKEKIKKFKK